MHIKNDKKCGKTKMEKQKFDRNVPMSVTAARFTAGT